MIYSKFFHFCKLCKLFNICDAVNYSIGSILTGITGTATATFLSSGYVIEGSNVKVLLGNAEHP